jgi:type I restriction enzyme M protein
VRGRAAIVLNGSPLFTGRAGSGESEIRRWVIESDLLDAIIALPTDMFYNTGIATYIWVLDRKKPIERRGYVQLIDGSQMFTKMRKSLGSKRKELLPADIETLVKLYAAFDDADDKRSKVFPGETFGFHTITVERPLRLAYQATAVRIDEAIQAKAVQKLDESTQEQLRRALQTLDRETVWRDRPAFNQALGKVLGLAGLQVGSPVRKAIHAALSERDESAEVCTDAKGNPEPDPKLRDTENVPLGQDIDEYVAREVLPYIPDAWVDHAKTKVGFEIPFTRHFYEYVPPRPLEEIDADVKRLIADIQHLFAELDS